MWRPKREKHSSNECICIQYRAISNIFHILQVILELHMYTSPDFIISSPASPSVELSSPSPSLDLSPAPSASSSCHSTCIPYPESFRYDDGDSAGSTSGPSLFISSRSSSSSRFLICGSIVLQKTDSLNLCTKNQSRSTFPI